MKARILSVRMHFHPNRLFGRSLVHLELCSRSAKNIPMSIVCRLSIGRPSLAFHIFDILSRTMLDWAETWEALWQHWDSELLKSFHSNIQDAAILKFFKLHLLPNRKSDRAKTWWEVSQWHRDFGIAKIVLFRYPRMPRHDGYLEILQTTSPPKP